MFGRMVFICNLCFIGAVMLRYMELARQKTGNFDGALGFQPLESTLVVLGYGAIIINAVFLLLVIFQKLTRRSNFTPAWLVWFNIGIFPIQVYYHFLAS